MTTDATEKIWVKTRELFIKVNKQPDCKAVAVEPGDSVRDAHKDQKKPFICENGVKITIEYFREKYILNIPQDYAWDGASIPQLFWNFIGSKGDPRFLIPSMVHDFLCENKKLIKRDRNLSSLIFRELLKRCDVSGFKAQAMYLCVDNFQRFCSGWK